eukprot:1365666-Amphidinium_carterae.1
MEASLRIGIRGVPTRTRKEEQGRWQACGYVRRLACLLCLQAGQGWQDGSAWSAGEEPKASLYRSGADSEEADCRHQGRSGVATAPAGSQLEGSRAVQKTCCTPCEGPAGAAPCPGPYLGGQEGAAQARDALCEELVTVYLCLERLRGAAFKSLLQTPVAAVSGTGPGRAFGDAHLHQGQS